MDGVTVKLYKNTVKVFETSSKASVLESIRDVKEKTNKALTEIIENSSNGDVAADVKKGAGTDSIDMEDESEEDEEDPQSKKMKLT